MRKKDDCDTERPKLKRFKAALPSILLATCFTVFGVLLEKWWDALVGEDERRNYTKLAYEELYLRFHRAIDVGLAMEPLPIHVRLRVLFESEKSETGESVFQGLTTNNILKELTKLEENAEAVAILNRISDHENSALNLSSGDDSSAEKINRELWSYYECLLMARTSRGSSFGIINSEGTYCVRIFDRGSEFFFRFNRPVCPQLVDPLQPVSWMRHPRFKDYVCDGLFVTISRTPRFSQEDINRYLAESKLLPTSFLSYY